jgi:putative transposase
MVEHPGGYRWSSYPYNANGIEDDLIVPHELYMRLGASPTVRCQAYRSLFKSALDPDTVDIIRENTNKAWVLGNDRFRQQIEGLLERQAAPKPRGGRHDHDESNRV